MPSGDRGRELNINRPESSPKPLPVIDSDDDDDGEDADDWGDIMMMMRKMLTMEVMVWNGMAT